MIKKILVYFFKLLPIQNIFLLPSQKCIEAPPTNPSQNQSIQQKLYFLQQLKDEKELKFEGVTVEDKDFSQLPLSRAIFNECKFINVDFREAKLDEAEFNECYFIGDVKFNGIVGKIKFTQCVFENTHFSEANLEGAKFDRCYLKNISFSNQSAIWIQFLHCDLHHCEFNHVDLRYADFTGSQVHDSTFLKPILFEPRTESRPLAKWSKYSNLKGVDQLHLPDWRDANLKNLVFYRTRFEQVDFSDMVLIGTRFIECYFSEIDFRRTDLRKVFLNEPKIDKNIQLEGALLAEGLKFNSTTSLDELVHKYNEFIITDQRDKADGLNTAFIFLKLHSGNDREFRFNQN